MLKKITSIAAAAAVLAAALPVNAVNSFADEGLVDSGINYTESVDDHTESRSGIHFDSMGKLLSRKHQGIFPDRQPCTFLYRHRAVFVGSERHDR